VTETGVVAGPVLTDLVSLGVLASRVPRDAVDDAVAATGKGARRRGGKLPPHVVVYLVMALALFAGEDSEDGQSGVAMSGCAPESGTWTTARIRPVRDHSFIDRTAVALHATHLLRPSQPEARLHFSSISCIMML
jgi:Insertion element 4 transposase N-terminal